MIGVGYEGLDVDSLLSRLRLRDVVTVVDIRLNPISRKRGMSKNKLAEALAAHGIGYEHMPALGNPRDNRDGFADIDGKAGLEARARFDSILGTENATAALQRLTELSENSMIALLCFEADEASCHRHLVLDRLRERQSVSA